MNMYNNFMGQGMVPNQYQQPKTLNWLPAEDYALLQKGLSQFKLSITKEELAKGQCNHYDRQNGMSALVPDADGSGGCTCSICGTHFYSKDYTPEEIKMAVDNILDILNTIKIMYLSLDPNAALEYFQIIPFIGKIPELYNIAVADFKRYEGVDSFVPGQGNNGLNPFNVYALMTQPGWGMNMVPNQQMGYGYPQQGQQMAQPQQPGMAPQPQVAPQQGQQMYGFNPNMQQMNAGFAQQNPQYNPMFSGMMIQPGYQPQQQGFSMNPMGAAAPQQGYVNTNMPNAMNPTGNATAPAASTTEATAEKK